MTKAELIIWLVVLAVGLPSAWRNPTAAALVIAWISGQIIAIITGNGLPLEYYLYPDIFVLSVIFAMSERTKADWFVAATFPVMWALYVADIHPFYKWWYLYYLALAQFIAAGADTLISYRRTRAADTRGAPSSGEFQFAFARRGYG